MNLSTLRMVGVVAASVVSLMAGVVVAWPGGDPPQPGWGTMTCSKVIDGTTVTVTCTVSFADCAVYYKEYPPQPDGQWTCDAAKRTRYCMDVCDIDGALIAIQCVCDCTDSTTRPHHANCPANP